VAGIGNPRQCRCDIDRADGGCHTWRAPVPCRARVGLDTGVNLAVCAGVGPVSSAVGKTFFYRIQTPASPLPEAGRAGCVCTRPSGSFRRIRYRPSVPTPVITKQLRRSDPLHASDRRRHLMSDSGRRSQEPVVTQPSTTADTSSSRDRVTLSLAGVRIELTGAHAERIVRFVLGQLGGARC
jgi:hypothetical protein